MLDVHAPEHSIGGVRDFFLHLFTITCGLLIALGLEDAATGLHHRHERREAEASIRQELQENLAAAREAAPELVKERNSLQAVLTFLQARSEGQQTPPSPKANLEFTEGNLPDAAWRTASSTGVLSLLEYDEVKHFAAAYKEQDLLQATLERTLTDYLQLGSIAPQSGSLDKITPAEAREALPYVRRTLGDLNGVLAVGRGLMDTYQHALQ